MAGRGKKVTDAHIELHADDSKLIPEVKVKAQRVGREYGSQLNKSLRQLKFETVDIKASPREALAAINKAEARLRELSRNAESVEIKVRTESALKQLGLFRKRLGDVGNDAGPEAAAGFAARFSARVGPLLANAPISGPLAIAAGTAGAAMAPLIGGLLAAGVIGGAGIGGVVGGVILAARDERVTTAAENLGARLNKRLERAAGGFVSPALQGLAEIERSADRIDIEGIFKSSARFVPVLTAGITSAIDDLGDGFETLVSRADPVIAAISRLASSTGQTLGNSFKLLATDAEAGASSLDDLTGALNYFITTTVGMVHGLAQIKGALDGLDNGIDSARRGIEDFFTGMSGGRAEFDITADGMGVAEARAKALADSTAAAGQSGSKAAGIFGGAVKPAVEAAGVAASATAVKFEAMSAAAMRVTNTNLSAAEASLSLRNAAVAAGEAVDKKSRVSRAEEGALISLARATNTSTAALDEQGRTVGEATRAHESNRRKLIATAVQMGYTKAEARKLADQYLATPKNVNTKINQPGMPDSQQQVRNYHKQLNDLARTIKTTVSVRGDREAYAKLEKLLVSQQALSKGIPISAARAAFNKNAYYAGGWTGPGPKYQPAGLVHADEFVVRKEARQSIERQMPGLLDAMNRTGRAPGYAEGGRVLTAPFVVSAAMTRIPSLAEALSKVTAAFGDWPSSPSAQRGDSGVWRRIVALIRSTGPFSGSFGNGYRPGDPKWHGSGRAVDWMGFNQDRLAQFLAARKPLELIHRTSQRDYAYTRGRNMGSFNESLMNAHRNHVHAAFAEGGRVPIAKVGRADTGRTTLEQGWNLIRNETGQKEHMQVGAEETVDVLRQMLSALLSLAPAMGEEVGRRVGTAGRADISLGARAELFARTG